MLPVTPVPLTDARYMGVSGSPVPALICVEAVHSLSTAPLHPLSSDPPRNPIPVVYCIVNDATCRWSKFESERSPLTFSQSCAIRFPPCPRPPRLASSIDFENVYWSSAVNPLRRRRRSWKSPACRVELPLDVRYAYPDGHVRQGLTAPAGNV